MAGLGTSLLSGSSTQRGFFVVVVLVNLIVSVVVIIIVVIVVLLELLAGKMTVDRQELNEVPSEEGGGLSWPFSCCTF